MSTDNIRTGLADVLSSIRKVRVTCLDEAGNEILISDEYRARSGDTLVYKVPEPEDVTISLG